MPNNRNLREAPKNQPLQDLYPSPLSSEQLFKKRNAFTKDLPEYEIDHSSKTTRSIKDWVVFIIVVLILAAALYAGIAWAVHFMNTQ